MMKELAFVAALAVAGLTIAGGAAVVEAVGSITEVAASAPVGSISAE